MKLSLWLAAGTVHTADTLIEASVLQDTTELFRKTTWEHDVRHEILTQDTLNLTLNIQQEAAKHVFSLFAKHNFLKLI